ncbi:MAG: ethanolamine ammonia-lyase reactivating factor EutA [Candidatus Obscuribacterales bacterium]|nr:ethanolamine ammonia-lyase reactivating factor EutA [Candidatus Obscuribacterales bacterium]
MADSIISAGIDIGTSTSHLSISRLKLGNSETATRVPKLAVLERSIIFKSEIYRTPLNADSSINAEAVAELLKKAYAQAKISANEIQTGAVIITGETARLRNARELSAAIAKLAGDFVVAAAGWELEGLLAGRGSGAEFLSRQKQKTICNIDIGGGTSNFSVFSDGKLIDSACLSIGGRCIQFDEENKLCALSESGETFLDGVAKLNLFRQGEIISEDQLELVSALLAEIILHTASSSSPPQIVQRLLQSEALSQNYKIDEYRFSGGVATCMREKFDNPYLFGDLGIFLAEAMLAALKEKEINYSLAEDGIRATVIGAGMHSLQLSGSTILVSDGTLPIRNARIIRPFRPGDENLAANEIQSILSAYLCEEMRGEADEAIALAVCDLSKLSYDRLQCWAKALADCHLNSKSKAPLIVLSREDIGLALGQTIKRYCRELQIIILDDVDSSIGDYIDIGKAIPNNNSVPLTVKTLIFNT